MDITKYKTLCWDLDGTLFDHPHSYEFAAYISENEHNQKHVIVTHRTHSLVDEIDDDLEALGLDRLNFAAVHHPSDEMYELYYISGRFAHIKEPMDDPNYVNWVTWKGRICSEYENPLMIDDNFKVVEQGCRKFGVDLIHPDHLII